MELWQLYLLTRFDAFGSLFHGLGVASLIGLIGGGFFYFMCLDLAPDNIPIMRRIAKFSIAGLIISSLGTALTPSNRDAYLILGGYYLTNNEEVMKLPTNAAKAANEFLNEYVKGDKYDNSKNESSRDSGT